MEGTPFSDIGSRNKRAVQWKDQTVLKLMEVHGEGSPVIPNPHFCATVSAHQFKKKLFMTTF